MPSQPVLPLLTEVEARSLTDQIKECAEKIWALLLEAHERKAWKALGYLNWEAYVRAEFDMGRQYSYRLLDQGRVIREIGAASGLSPNGDISITEAQSRDLKPHLPEVVAEVQRQIANVPAEQVAQVVQQVIENERDRITATREGREACRALAQELNLKPQTDAEKEAVQVMYGLYEAIEEIEKMPPADAAGRLVKPYERRYIEKIPGVIKWLSDFVEVTR